MYAFLSALPAVLGLVGFVVFQYLRSQHRGDAITPRIVEKLRSDHPDRFAQHNALTSKQLHDLLLNDQSLRHEVDRQDFLLLEQTLRQQHVQTLFVYSITSVLVVLGLALFTYQATRPVPTNIAGIHLEATIPDAVGNLVDLDELRLSWQSFGEVAEVNVYLENVDTSQRTEFWSARSTDGQMLLSPSSYKAVIHERSFGKSNRIRVVFQTENNTFYSDAFLIHVGATLTAIVFEDRVKVAVLVDNWSLNDHVFEMKLVAPAKDSVNYLSVGGDVVGIHDFSIDDSSNYDWSDAKLVYLGSSTPWLYRTSLLYDS